MKGGLDQLITQLSNIGTYHRSINGENQDAVFTSENRRYTVISLADGVSSCVKSRIGAEIASRVMTDVLLRRGGDFLKFGIDDMAEFVLSHVLYELEWKAQEDSCPIEDYSSTIAGVLYDKKAQRILCINLGDSMIMGVKKADACAILAMPSDSTHGCCVTTTKGAAKVTDIKIFDADPLSSVFICSDGAWEQMFARTRLKPEVKMLLLNDEYENLGNYLKSQESFDDYSFIALRILDTQRRKAA